MDMFTAIEQKTPIRTLSIEEEIDLVRRARSGEDSATEQLLANYLPVMKKLIGREISAALGAPQRISIEYDDWQAAAVSGFYDALAAFDPRRHPRFSAVIQLRVIDALREARLAGLVIVVPTSSRVRFSQILAAADGDYPSALELAPSMSMDRQTFMAVAKAHNVGTSDTVQDALTHPVAERTAEVHIEDLHDAHRALDALDPTSRLIIETLFGIGDQPQMSEREAAEALGIPRTTLQRKAASALVVMRATLGA